MQRCLNRHGNFLTLEEYDGRRKCGTILILEGRFGQGWKLFTGKIQWAYSALGEVREIRKEKEVKRKRSFVEVMALKENTMEECFESFPEPIARVPRWWK